MIFLNQILIYHFFNSNIILKGGLYDVPIKDPQSGRHTRRHELHISGYAVGSSRYKRIINIIFDINVVFNNLLLNFIKRAQRKSQTPIRSSLCLAVNSNIAMSNNCTFFLFFFVKKRTASFVEFLHQPKTIEARYLSILKVASGTYSKSSPK